MTRSPQDPPPVSHDDPAAGGARGPGALDRIEPGPDVPAHRVPTTRAWEDLVLPHATLEQLLEVERGIPGAGTPRDAPGSGPGRPPGFRALFRGPPGSGKTLAASLIAGRRARDLYRVDLSRVVSKWVGETERALARAFELAERAQWVLFLDEADALFGERAPAPGADDRLRDAAARFLLQRLDAYGGVAIVALDPRARVDGAFLRRFRAIVEFPLPGPSERLALWQGALPGQAGPGDLPDLRRLAEQYAVTGGAIVDAVRAASLRAGARGDGVVRLADVEEELRRGMP